MRSEEAATLLRFPAAREEKTSSFPFFDLITLACVGRSPTDVAAVATALSWKAYLMGVISTREGGGGVGAPLTHLSDRLLVYLCC